MLNKLLMTIMWALTMIGLFCLAVELVILLARLV